MGIRSRQIATALLFAAVALIGSLSPSQPGAQPQEVQRADIAEQADTDGGARESFIDRTVSDPVAIFTLIIAGANVLLVGTTIWIARENGRGLQIIQRAYISVAPGDVHLVRNPEGFAIANITVRNGGNLPARSVRWAIKHAFSDDKRLESFPVDPVEAEGKIAMAPALEMTQGSPLVSVRDEALPSPRDRYLYVWGAVFYEDGFGRSRATRFCHRFNCRNFTGMAIAARFARYHRYGNEAD